MPNSVESTARRVVALLRPNDEHSLDVLERACDLYESESPWVGHATPEPRISTRTIAIAALLVSLCLPPILPLDEIIGTATAFRGPAVGHHELELITHTVRAGQPLVIKTHFQYLRVCSWTWVLEWKTAEGKPIAINWHHGSAHVIGAESDHEMAMELPIGIKPGNYIFRESATGDCGRGDIVQIAPEEVAFTVTD